MDLICNILAHTSHVSPEDSSRPVSKETGVTQTLNKIFCSKQTENNCVFLLVQHPPAQSPCSSTMAFMAVMIDLSV